MIAMTEPVLSVIIPTYNRHEILAKCLLALKHQRLASGRYEIIVVDDGSRDCSEEVVQDMMPVVSGLSLLKQNHRGPAAARNLGIRNARGEILLFIGDDVIASPDLVGEHLQWHMGKYPEDHFAILGLVTWSPELYASPFMKWLEHGGPQFGFYQFRHDHPVPPGDLYTANVSYKKSFMLQNGVFDEDFPYAAFEDSELGARLAKRGLTGIFNAKALGYHHHAITFSSYCRRMEKVGISSKILCDKLNMGDVGSFRHASRLRKWVKALSYPLYRQVLTFLDAHSTICVPRHYLRVLEYYRIKGIEKALRC